MTAQNRKRDEKTGLFLKQQKADMTTISTRVTKKERGIIAQSAARNGLTVCEYVRWCIQLQQFAEAKERVTGADHNASSPLVPYVTIKA